MDVDRYMDLTEQISKTNALMADLESQVAQLRFQRDRLQNERYQMVQAEFKRATEGKSE